MQHSLKSVLATTVTVHGKKIPVVTLPEEIQNELETMHLYHQDYVKAMLALEKAEILLNYKKEQVQQQLLALFPEPQPTPTDAY